jgi:hypothetical protein
MSGKKIRRVHSSISEIDRNFENLLEKREKDLKAGRDAYSFDDCIVDVCLDGLMNACYNSNIPKSYEFEDGDIIGNALELTEDRTVDSFLDSKIECQEETTTEQVIKNMRKFFSEIEGLSDVEKEMIAKHPETESVINDVYSDYRTVETFFKKYESQLSV